jgi:uroporphyrinogen-III synthase
MRHAGSRCLVLRVIHLARPAEGALPDVLLALMRGSYAYISVSSPICFRLFLDSTHQYRMSITV